MPQQEIFFEQQLENRRIEVLKTYDAAFARDAFEQMDEGALRFLSQSLDLSTKYEDQEGATPGSPEFVELLWAEVEDGAREDWKTFSYFVVTEKADTMSIPVYVSSDWPSAQAFVKQLISVTEAEA